ncbi:MAG: DUF547 domain-containing protein [Xanthomonadales bacterium]|nr:DUF547 domain-containing protein [Xanthomonadales bacterium]
MKWIVPLFLLWPLGVAAFDHGHARLAGVLDRFVADGAVDYAGLAADRRQLDGYLEDMAAPSASEFGSWGRNQQLAYWLNLYNAAVLHTVIDHYPIRGRTFRGLGKPRNSIWQIPGVWKKILHRGPGGRRLSLDQIEHDIIRPEFREPRIHFALVCAARGCPVLRDEPYRADRLEQQLEQQTRAFLQQANGAQVGESNVAVSRIFKWFSEDFSADEFACGTGRHAGVLGFVARYRELACDPGGAPDLDYLDYDWRLNDIE